MKDIEKIKDELRVSIISTIMFLDKDSQTTISPYYVTPETFLNMIAQWMVSDYFSTYINPHLENVRPLIEEILEEMVKDGWMKKDEHDGQILYYDLLPDLLKDTKENQNVEKKSNIKEVKE